MSYELIRGITVEQDKVYLTSADSNVSPRMFAKWECEPFSKILAEEGRDALLAKIGEEVWNGEIQLQRGNKLCKLFLAAREALPADMNFSNYDSKTAGEYLGKMVAKLERDPAADLSADVQEMLTLRNDRDHILTCAKQTGFNFLNYATDPEVQQDRELALEVLKAGGKCAWFSYPVWFNKDREFAMEALKLNGCFYRELDESLKKDREIIVQAFREEPGKQFHEHLPDLIPPDVYCRMDDENRVSIDLDFIYELLEICPAMHLDRNRLLLHDRDIALKWCEVGKFFPHSITDLPEQFLRDEEFQDVLCKRFEGSDKYDYLIRNFSLKGVLLSAPGESVDHKIRSAQARQCEQMAQDLEHKEQENHR